MPIEHFYVKIVYRLSTTRDGPAISQWLETEVVPRFEVVVRDIFRPPRWRRPTEELYRTDKVYVYSQGAVDDWEIYPKAIITAETDLPREDQMDDFDLLADGLESSLDEAITAEIDIDTTAKSIQYRRRPPREEGDWG